MTDERTCPKCGGSGKVPPFRPKRLPPWMRPDPDGPVAQIESFTLDPTIPPPVKVTHIDWDKFVGLLREGKPEVSDERR